MNLEYENRKFTDMIKDDELLLSEDLEETIDLTEIQQEIQKLEDTIELDMVLNE